MRPADLLAFALAPLWQTKARTLTTLAGVALGTAMLAVSLALSHGLRTLVAAEFHKDETMRQIFITPGGRPAADESAIPPEVLAVPAGLGESRRERYRQFLVRQWRAKQPADERGLTADRLAAVAQLDHVAGVLPVVYEPAEVVVNGEPRLAGISLLAPGPTAVAARVVFGRLPAADAAEVALPEDRLFEWGVVEDAAVERLLGKPLRLEVKDDRNGGANLLRAALGLTGDLSAAEAGALDAAADKLPDLLDELDLSAAQKKLVGELRRRGRAGPPARAAAEFVAVGVVRASGRKPRIGDDDVEDGDLILPLRAGRALLERLPRVAEHGYHRAVVRVDDERHLRAVNGELKRLGVNAYSMAELADRALQEVTLIGLSMSVLSALALAVAGLGIANTTATAVLERTRDIGVMKAVGAKDRHVLAMFLVEGAVLGAAGGLLGLALAGLAAWAGEGYINRAVAQITGEPVAGPVFLFPAGLFAGVPAFVLVVTTLAALAPARRAARTDPAATLRAE